MKIKSIGLALAMVTLCPIASAQWFTLNSGTVLRTTDGGTIWTVQTSGTTVPLYAVSFTHANTGTAVGDSGIIIHTTNGGATWLGKSTLIGHIIKLLMILPQHLIQGSS